MEARYLRRLLLSFLLATLTLFSWRSTVVGQDQPFQIYHAHFGQDVVLLGTTEGLYRLTKQGWDVIRTDDYLKFSVSEDGAIYAYTYSSVQDISELEVSLDGGDTWATVSLPADAYLGSLRPSATPISSTVYLSAHYQPPLDPPAEVGVWRSTDFGATWEHLFRSNASNLRFSPDFAEDGLMFAESIGYHVTGPVLRSTDWGESWEVSLSNLRPQSWATKIVMSPSISEDDTVFAMYPYEAEREMLFYKSEDRGKNWHQVSSLPVPLYDLAISPKYDVDGTLFTGRYLSQDGGQTWDSVISPRAIPSAGIRLNQPFRAWPPEQAAEPVGPYRGYLPLVALDKPPSLDLWIVVVPDHVADDFMLWRRTGLDASWVQELP